MSDGARCPTCGDSLPGGDAGAQLGGMCPRCLVGGLGQETRTGMEGTRSASAPPPLKPGAVFRGHEVLEVLGRGGMGTVYKARQQSLDRPVALKVLSPELASSEEFVKRFDREAKALASLNHPNIVHVFEFGREGDLFFLTMEQVQGRTLESAFDQKEPLDIGWILEVLIQVARGLEGIHGSGLVHRDIKPSNILIAADGTAKIGDFGIAVETQNVQKLTETGMFVGTPHYVSPEHVQGKRVDGRSDLYSLGVILYEGLAGRPPFEGKTPTAVLMKHVKETPPPLYKLAPGAPPALQELTRRLLAKNPASRPESAAAVVRELERILEEIRSPEPRAGVRPGVALPHGPRPRRLEAAGILQRGWRGFAGAAAALVLVLVLLSLFRGASPPAPVPTKAPTAREADRPAPKPPESKELRRVDEGLPTPVREPAAPAQVIPAQPAPSAPRTLEQVFREADQLLEEAKKEYNDAKLQGSREGFDRAGFKAEDAKRKYQAAQELAEGEKQRQAATQISLVAQLLKLIQDGRKAAAAPVPSPVLLPAPAGSAPPAPAPPAVRVRMGVPEPAKQKEAEKLIREIYREDYARRSPRELQAFAAKLLLAARRAPPARGASGDLDLLNMIDPSVDAIVGSWELKESTLVVRDTPANQLQIPYVPPEEYDLEILAERRVNYSGLAVGLAFGTVQVDIPMDWGSENLSGIHLVDGKHCDVNGTGYKGPIFPLGKPSTILCSVRKAGITVVVDGKMIVHWTSGYERLSRSPWWKIPNNNTLFLGGGGLFHISRMVLRAVSGTGRPLRAPLDRELGLASRWVLLREAQDLACQCWDVAVAMDAAGEMARSFEVDEAATKMAALARIAALATGADSSRALAEAYCKIAEDALATDSHDTAVMAAQRAEALAKAAQEPALGVRSQELRRTASFLRDEFQKVKPALEKPGSGNPEDLGKYFCFVKGDWQKGLPILAASSTQPIKGLAGKDLALPTEPSKQIEVADGWWEAAEKEIAPPKRDRIKERARYWYELALPGATALLRMKIEKRLDVLGSSPARPAGHATGGLIGHWKFDEGSGEIAADSSGSGHTGKVVGNVQWTAGRIRGALKLGTGKSWVEVADAEDLRVAGDLTLALWVRKDMEAGDWVCLVGKGDADQRNYGLWLEPDGPRVVYQQLSGAGINHYSTKPLPIGVWTHLAVTVEGNTIRLYFDGVEDAAGNRPGRPATPAAPLGIGWACRHASLSGALDDVRIYNRALSGAEIRVLFSAAERAGGAVDRAAPAVDVDGMSVKLSALAAAGKAAKLPEECSGLAEALLKLIDELLQADQYDPAEKAAASALQFARRSNDSELVSRATTRSKEVAEAKSLFRSMKSAMETQARNPDDPAANLEIGRFLCFVKGSWDLGLRFMAKGSDAALKVLAAQELAFPLQPADRAALADGWYALAEKEMSPLRKSRLMAHALSVYESALIDAKGLLRVRIENRLNLVKPARTGPIDATTLPLKRSTVGFGALEIHTDGGPRVLNVLGKNCRTYIYAHAPSSVVFDIPSGSRLFTAVGVVAQPGIQGHWKYVVNVDGKTLYKSQPLSQIPNQEARISVPLPLGAKEIELQVDDLGDRTADWSVWALPTFVK